MGVKVNGAAVRAKVVVKIKDKVVEAINGIDYA
jgi:hypothetical protein